MRESGIKSKKEFELTASGLGLYFDKPRFGFLWLFSGRGLWVLFGAMGLLALALTFLSVVTQMRGLFTINMSQGMFREGYSLSEELSFRTSSGNLFAQPAIDIPCISIVQIPDKIYDNSLWKNPAAAAFILKKRSRLYFFSALSYFSSSITVIPALFPRNSIASG